MDHEELVAEVRSTVAKRGRRYDLSFADQEDVTQDVVMKYLHAWTDGTAPKNVAGWINTAVGNLLVDRFRAAQRRPADNYAEGEDAPVAAAMEAIWDTRFASAPAVSEELLAKVLGLVPEEDAHLICRRYLDRWSAAELAAELGATASAVDQRTTRAKRRLRDALASRPDLVDELKNPHPRVY